MDSLAAGANLGWHGSCHEGIGLYKNEQDAFERVYKPGKSYHPNSQLAGTYAGLYQIYKQLYPTLKPISHQLYDHFRVKTKESTP
jgi:hypothetical protein